MNTYRNKSKCKKRKDKRIADKIRSKKERDQECLKYI